MARMDRVGVVAVALCWTAPGLASDNLECISTGYSAEQNATFERHIQSFSISMAEREQVLTAEVLEFVTARASECADQNSWSPESIESAIFYRIYELLSQAVERHSPFTPAQMSRLSDTIDGADQATLLRIFSPMLIAAENETRAPDISPADASFVGRLVLRAGIPPTEANAGYVGALLGGRLGKIMYRQRFQQQ